MLQCLVIHEGAARNVFCLRGYLEMAHERVFFVPSFDLTAVKLRNILVILDAQIHNMVSANGAVVNF